MKADVVTAIIEGLVLVFSKSRPGKKSVIPLLQEAEKIAGLDNDARREFVVAKLMDQGMTESAARTLTEVAVAYYKKLQAKELKKRERAERRAARKAARKAASP